MAWADTLIITAALATIAIEDLGGAAWIEHISPGLADAEARHQIAAGDLRHTAQRLGAPRRAGLPRPSPDDERARSGAALD